MSSAGPSAGDDGGAPDLIIGLDDTDVVGSPGTNQLARRIVDALPQGFAGDTVLRHQLLQDPRIPFTTRNGAASIGVRVTGHHTGDAFPAQLIAFLESAILGFAPPGSDPGLALGRPGGERAAALLAFGRQCQSEPVLPAQARELAATHGVRLVGLGGTEDGVIGALAAVGLRAGGYDGRVVHRRGWPWPDPFGGVRTVEEVLGRGVDEVRVLATGEAVRAGRVDVGKRLRPAFRGGRVVLMVEPAAGAGGADWRGLKLP